MLKHYWITASRLLLRKKLFTIINLTGLSLGIAIFLAFTGFVNYHLSFDQFYPDGDRIYRIDYFEYQEGQPVLQSAQTHDRTTLLVHEYVPQVEAVTRIYFEKAYVFTEDIRLVDQDMLFADSSFFQVFKINLIEGSSESCLTPPRAVVISKSQAEVYFGNENPMGKTLFFNEHLPFTVTGVFDDIPETSSIDFDFLISWSTLSYYGWVPKEGSFRYPWCFTFVKIGESVSDIDVINQNLTRLVNDQNQELINRRHTAQHELHPYSSLHFTSGLSGEIKPGINKVLLFALISLAIFSLIVAWINYVNLALAQSLERAYEIGVRKVFGASRSIISGQFVLEAIFFSVVSFLIGFGLFYVITQQFKPSQFQEVTFAFPNFIHLILYSTGFISITILASLYPAYFIARYNPILILNNKLSRGKGKANVLHQALIVFQMFLAVAVVGIALIANRQLSFIQSFDTGFNTQQTIALRAPASTNSDSMRLSRYRVFRNEVLQHASFVSGTSSMNIPGEEIRFHDENLRPIGSLNEKKQSFQVMWIDEGYQETFGMILLAGRNFNAEELGNACIINETAAHALGYSTPTDAVNTKLITQDDRTVSIIGVWKDYHQQSLRKTVEPIVFYYRHPYEYGYYSFRVLPTEGSYLQTLKQIWSEHYPNDTFNYYLMDRFYARQYQTDQLFSTLLQLFSIISIAIACLGLFGMATLMIVKRTREIGVRKVLGASAWSILLLLSKQYVSLVLVSCLFAFPVAWHVSYQWLSGFSYRIAIQWWMIVIPGLLVLLAILVTISIQALKAAMANPVKTLRDQ
jgi:putative ABC transport system permease protein